jgi:hypothetical protein
MVWLSCETGPAGEDPAQTAWRTADASQSTGARPRISAGRSDCRAGGRVPRVTRYIPTFGDPKMAWGYGLSPVVLDDSVLFPWDHHTGPCYLIGLDKKTGRPAWKKNRPIGTAHQHFQAVILRVLCSLR